MWIGGRWKFFGRKSDKFGKRESYWWSRFNSAPCRTSWGRRESSLGRVSLRSSLDSEKPNQVVSEFWRIWFIQLVFPKENHVASRAWVLLRVHGIILILKIIINEIERSIDLSISHDSMIRVFRVSFRSRSKLWESPVHFLVWIPMNAEQWESLFPRPSIRNSKKRDVWKIGWEMLVIRRIGWELVDRWMGW